MARMKDLLIDLQTYDELNEDEQKRIRETYCITKKDVAEILAVMGGN